MQTNVEKIVITENSLENKKIIENINKSDTNTVEFELKELRKRKFEIDKDLEKKMDKLNELSEENKNLHVVNQNLRENLKNEKMPSIKLKRNSNDGSSIKNSLNCSMEKKKMFNLNQFEDMSILKLQDELEHTELIYKTKKNFLIDLKKQTRLNIKKLEHKIKEISDLVTNSKILNEELVKLTHEYKTKSKEIEEENKNNYNSPVKLSNSSNNVLNIIDTVNKTLKDKNKIEKLILSDKIEIKNIYNEISSSIEKFNIALFTIEENQNLFANLTYDKFTLKNKLKNIENKSEKSEAFFKSIEPEINAIRSKLNKNKIEILKIEEEMNNKLYFIRFSNSLVRSYFNIINTRRLQIEMVKNLNKQEKSVYDLMFKKLDELENSLFKEYSDYLFLCGEGGREDCDQSESNVY